MAFWAAIPAAGIGERMQADRPKQYLQLADRLVIEQTLHRLAAHPDLAGIVVAISPHDTLWPTVTLPAGCRIEVIEGGAQRVDSVLNALIALSQQLDDDPWVLVHDAARPCVRLADIDKMLALLADHPVGGILGVPVHDTVKRTTADDTISSTVDRRDLWRAMTPQMFRLRGLMAALQQALAESLPVTDEASAMEAAGLNPVMVEGHGDNIKITVPEDLALAAWYLQQQDKQ